MLHRGILAAVLVSTCAVASWHAGASRVLASTQEAETLLFHASGSGITNTRRFRVPGTWRIVYSFSHCEISGFSLYVKGGPDDIATDLRKSGSGVQYEYGAGNVYLTLNTACSWRVAAYAGKWIVNGPGLKVAGNGITNTIAFRAPSEWQIHYSYWSCDIPGFSIYEHGGDDDIASKEGSHGSGVQYEHSGGTISLTINTGCFWRIAIAR